MVMHSVNCNLAEDKYNDQQGIAATAETKNSYETFSGPLFYGIYEIYNFFLVTSFVTFL